MVRRTSFGGASCPVARAVDVLGDWWSLLIVRDAFDGVRRFGEFQQSLGVSKGILATRLRKLVEAGILAQAPAADGSVYRDYLLTPRGEALFPIIVGLRQWAEDHCFQPGEAHSRLTERRTGRPVPRMVARDTEGRVLDAIDTVVRKLDGPA